LNDSIAKLTMDDATVAIHRRKSGRTGFSECTIRMHSVDTLEPAQLVAATGTGRISWFWFVPARQDDEGLNFPL
jgi:hypothetical protein